MENNDQYGYRKLIRFFSPDLNLKKRILDIGCGNGTEITLPLARRGLDITGVDMQPEGIAWANAHNVYPNAKFICGRFEDQNLGLFDVVICSYILEHLDYPVPFLKEVKRVLSPDGILFVTVPNGYGAFEIEKKVTKSFMKWLIKRIKMQEDAPPLNPGCPHVQSFTMKKLKNILNETGFKVLEIEHGTFIGGSITNMIISKFPKFIDWNIKVTDKLPSWMVSLWYLKCRGS
jgi:2-polyprenyl-3-methyl-5-hydroxy-6-metoxy-1,4-benzoquinol methylase